MMEATADDCIPPLVTAVFTGSMRTINGRTRQQLGKRSERAAIIAGDRIEFLVKAFAMEGKELTLLAMPQI